MRAYIVIFFYYFETMIELSIKIIFCHRKEVLIGISLQEAPFSPISPICKQSVRGHYWKNSELNLVLEFIM